MESALLNRSFIMTNKQLKESLLFSYFAFAFLIIVVTYFLPNSSSFPLNEDEARTCVYIILPTFLMNLGSMFRYFFSQAHEDDLTNSEKTRLNPFIVFLPIITCLVLFGFGVLQLFFSNSSSSTSTFSPKNFQGIIAIIITIHNLSIVYFIKRFF